MTLPAGTLVTVYEPNGVGNYDTLLVDSSEFGGGGITPAAPLTVNVIPKATSATQIDNSIITDDGTDFIIAGAPSAGGNSGQNIFIQAGNDTTGDGPGNLQIHGGDGDGVDTSGGNVAIVAGGDGGGGAGNLSLIGGASLTTAVAAGRAILSGGSAFVGDATGGNAVVDGGPGHGTGRNGDVVLGSAATTPASAAAAGTAGAFAWDADYIYICVATNTWKRAALATWP